MSTKKLSKTIVEGHNYGKWDRHLSHKEDRARQKNYLSEVSQDVENYYEYDIEPSRSVWGGSRGSFGVMYRWLDSRLGQPWSEVRSALTHLLGSRLDQNTWMLRTLDEIEKPNIASWRHSSPPDDPTTSHSKHDYYLDAGGLLQKKKYIGRRKQDEAVPHFDTNRLANWLGGRIVGKVGTKFFWFIPADKNKKRGGTDRIWKTVWGYQHHWGYWNGGGNGPHFQYLSYEVIYKKDSNGIQVLENGKLVELERKPEWKNGGPPSLRQGRKLNTKEMAFWNTIPVFYQTKILEVSPGYPNPPKYDYWGRLIS
jgi:hypothetical protein